MIQIKHKYDCCGCSACMQICPKKCISLKEDNEGFLYPSIKSSDCIDCHLCERICPIMNVSSPQKDVSVFAVINSDEEIRMQSSSGGVFTLLAQKVINEGGVVFGAKFNDKWEVVHGYSETLEGLSQFRGSKYVQSELGNCFIEAREFLNDGRKVLFSGTPCQIAGLHNYLRKHYDNLLTVDFVCHGVPSPGIWRKYLYEEFNHSALYGAAAGKNTVLSSSLNAMPVITGIEFRDKTLNGWKKFSFVVRGKSASKADKNSVLLSDMHKDNLYMKGFLRNIYLRPSCYHCAFKSFRSQSDITLADFWGVEKFYPEMNDDKGVSLVFTCSPSLKKFFLSADAKEIPLKYAANQNPSIFRSVRMRRNRNLFFSDLEKGKDLLESIGKRARWDRRETFRLALIKLLEKVHLLNLIKKVTR